MAYIIIIDGYSSGNLLAPLFAQLNKNQNSYKFLHIQSTKKLHNYYFNSFDKTHYELCIDYSEDYSHHFQLLCNKLSNYKLCFALAGIDSGTYLADKINDYFSLPGNNLSLSLVRKNKYLQRQHLLQSDLASTKYYLADNFNRLENWVNTQDHWPIVIKPVESANSQGVKLCYTLDEARQAFNIIMQTGYNQCGAHNSAVLVEKYLSGPEYRVNTVSYQDKHYLAEVWDVTKQINQQGDFIYHKISLIKSDDPINNLLKNYMFKLLAQFEISYGPASADIVLTKNGPALVEISARLMGEVLSQETLQNSLLLTQAQAVILAYTRPIKFLEQTATPYHTKNLLEIYFLKSKQAGLVSNINFLDDIKLLPSVIKINSLIKTGDQLKLTTDYGSSPIQIILSHPDEKQIKLDSHKIKAYEQLGIFTLN